MTMTVKHFNYAILSQAHLSTFFFGLLALLGISFYIIKDQFARIGILLMAIGMGVYVQRVDWMALPYFLILATLIYYGQNAVQTWLRGWSFLLGILLCLYSFMYPIPGLLPWEIVKNFQFSHNALPFSMTFNAQTFFVGLFFLWFSKASLFDEGSWKPVLKAFLLPSLAGIVVVMGVALYLRFVQVDFKPTNFYFIWAFHNLFYVCIAEEAVFRGMIQQFLTLHLQNAQGGKWLALVIASAVFGLAHFQGGWIYVGLAGLAGLFMGYAYMRTKKLEASILVHFMINSAHFLLFTYPALK